MEVFEPYYITCFRDDACGFTSRDGYVYDQAPDFSPGVYAVLEVDFESPQYSEGPLYLDQNQRDAVDAILLADAGELWGKPDKIVMDIFDISIFFDEINNTELPEAAYIVINQKYLSDYEQYLSRRLRALKSKTDFFDRLNSQTSQFKYLDLRFEDKIYMKFAE